MFLSVIRRSSTDTYVIILSEQRRCWNLLTLRSEQSKMKWLMINRSILSFSYRNRKCKAKFVFRNSTIVRPAAQWKLIVHIFAIPVTPPWLLVNTQRLLGFTEIIAQISLSLALTFRYEVA